MKIHPASANLPTDRQVAFAEFLRGGLLTMLRSIPVGMRIDQELRTSFPELQEAQAAAILRQLDDHAAILRPEVQKNIPAPALKANLAINVAFAKFWAAELGQPNFTAPYLRTDVMAVGENLLHGWHELPVDPKNDRQLIQEWADTLGLGSWVSWVEHDSDR